MHRRVWEKFLELLRKLSRQSFVMSYDQSRPIVIGYYVCHSKSFPCTCGAQECLLFHTTFEPFVELRNSCRLVTCGHKRIMQFENTIWHIEILLQILLKAIYMPFRHAERAEV